MKTKFLNFLEPKYLEDNTNATFDRSLEIKEFAPIQEAPYFYKQSFYFISVTESPEIYEASCWNDNIRSLVILNIPRYLYTHLKNVRIIQIRSGDIRAKRVSPINRKNARIIIELDDNVELELQRFKIDIENV